ncbi:OmpH family outer membrane protein [Aureispira anguillae]|uniref:OmpH family outer membrane protein n=1 Tax=Aureispira anguillae TaxID=2864201 RepID=A0A915YGK1_9BACT|nr:OmpH family outer membrane protein [Aureispira anguillae]BDS12573.1 OmpH family outer membrane protein [Aureispira anguillae]
MKNVLNLLSVLTVIAFMALGTTANAQKIAYIVSEDIVPEMPAYKRAKSEVEAYGKQLQKVLEAKQKEAQDYYQEIMEKAQRGELTPKQEQEAQAKLQKMQADLQKEAADADKKLMDKEGELTKPLYQELDNALKKVAKENQYSYILDKKFLLYSEGGIDATEKVKTALGISW